MSPAASIARFEWTRIWREPVTTAMLGLFALLSAYAVWSGSRWADARAETVAQAVAAADDTMALRRQSFVEMVAKGEKPNFGLIYATALPFRAALPNAPLAALSAGQAEGYPAAATISPFVDPRAIFDPHMAGLESAAVLSAGRFDLAFVVVILLPLLLIAATYDFWSRDVESGSARFQLAQPVRPTRLILIRAAVRGGTLLVGAALIAMLALLLAGGVGDAGGLAMFGLVVLAYGAVWIGLAILINLYVRGSTTAALTAGTAWLTVVLLLPAALSATADLIAPSPSALTYTNDLRTVGLAVRASHAEAARQAAEAESGRAYPATLWHNRREIGERDRSLAPIHHHHAFAQARHRTVANALGFASPAVIAQDALDRIAGTDAARALAFQDQARAFASGTRRLAFAWMDHDRLLTLADYDGGLPRFAFVEPRHSCALMGDLLALLGVTALLLTLATLRLRRSAAKLV